MIDPAYLEASQPKPIMSPIEAQTQVQSLANLGNVGQLQQGAIAMQPGQLVAQSQENQQRQDQIDTMKVVNDAYASAFKPDPAGGPPKLDINALQTAVATHNKGAALPGIMEAYSKAQSAQQALIEQRTKAATAQDDAYGATAQVVAKAGNNPATFLAMAQDGLNNQTFNPAVVGPAMNQIKQALATDPTGASAIPLVKQFTDGAIARSGEQQKQIAADKTATGAQLRGQAAADDAALLKQKALVQQRGSTLGQATDQPSWDTATATMARAGDDVTKIPAVFSPAAAALYANLGKTPAEISTEAGVAATARETALRDRQNANNQQLERQQEAARIGIEQRNQAYAQQTPSVSDPEYMRGVISGEIQVNPRDKNFAQTMAVAKSIDPTFTGDRYANRAATTKDFISGTNGKRIQSFNQVMTHVGELQSASDNLGTNLAQYGPNWLGKAISSDVVRYHDAADTAGAEIATLLAQGQATQGEADRTINNLKSANPQTRSAGIDEYVTLIGGRAKAIAQTYSSGTGDKFPVEQYIDPDAQSTAKAHGVDLHAIADKQAPAWMKSKFGGAIQNANPPGAAAPAAPAAPVAAGSAVTKAPLPPTGAAVHGIPDIGATFNGGKVLKVTRIQ